MKAKWRGRTWEKKANYFQRCTITSYLFRPNNKLTGQYERRRGEKKTERNKTEIRKTENRKKINSHIHILRSSTLINQCTNPSYDTM